MVRRGSSDSYWKGLGSMRYYIKSVFRIVLLFFIFVNNVHAGISFAGRDSAFILQTAGGVFSRFRVGPTTVNGWADGSIRKDNNLSQFNLRNEAFNSSGDYIITSSSAHDELIHSNSNAIVKLAATSTDLIVNNSNAIINLGKQVKNNSNALVAKCPLIMASSNAIINLDRRVTNNSNAINYLTGVSTTLVFQTSNAITHLSQQTVNNSNSIVNLYPQTINNSNAITYLTEQVVNNSDAIVYMDQQIVNNSNTIINLYSNVTNNSNAITYLTQQTVNNSNSIVAKCQEIMANSNAIINLDQRVTNNSNSITYLTNVNATLLLQTSNSIVHLTEQTVNNSNSIVNLTQQNFNNSNAIVYLTEQTINNSNSIVAKCQEIMANSNAIINLDQRVTNNSNAIILLNSLSNALVIQNSNAIIGIREDLATIDVGVPHIDITTSPHFLTFDLFISPDNLLRTHVDVTIDGGGHFIHFARNQANTFQIDPGTTVVLKNVVLKDFSDDVVQLGAGAELIFGDGTTVELAASESLSRNWSFVDNVTVNGFGNCLDLDLYGFELAQNGSLLLQNLQIQNVAGNNIRCVGDTGLITLRSSDLFLSRDFSYTTASLRFEKDVAISGTNVFNYTSVQVSTVASQSLLFLNKGLTLNYAPGADDRNLIAFEDVTSQLFLNGCTVRSTTTGLQLTKGTLCIDHKNEFFNDGAVALSQGIGFGNGIVADDLTIHLLPGGSVTLQSGILSYDNVAS